MTPIAASIPETPKTPLRKSNTSTTSQNTVHLLRPRIHITFKQYLYSLHLETIGRIPLGRSSQRASQFPKPKTAGGGLKALLNAKPKKLSTLDKSRLDWESHLETSEKDLRDELEANRKGGGYLEKVEFLGRVGDRLEETLENVKGGEEKAMTTAKAFKNIGTTSFFLFVSWVRCEAWPEIQYNCLQDDYLLLAVVLDIMKSPSHKTHLMRAIKSLELGLHERNHYTLSGSSTSLEPSLSTTRTLNFPTPIAIRFEISSMHRFRVLSPSSKGAVGS